MNKIKIKKWLIYAFTQSNFTLSDNSLSATLLTPLTRGKHYPPPQVLPRVPNLTQSPKLTQGLGHVATPEVEGNAYL